MFSFTLLAFLASLSLSASPAIASTPIRIELQPGDFQAAEPVGESRRRVFVLKDGRAVRGLAVLRGSTWHVEQPSGTSRLPASLVERVGDEKGLLREMKRKRRAIDSGGDGQDRRELARWTVENGLHVEALTTIDNLLRHDADDAVALELLNGMRLRLTIPQRVSFPMDNPEGATPDQIAALTRFAGEAMQPTTVENLAVMLRRTENRSALRSVLIAELHRPEEQRRETAALLMRRTLSVAELLGDAEAPAAEGNGRELRALIGRAARDVAGTVRKSAVRSLSYAGHPGVAAPFVNALQSKDAPRIAMNCAEALGQLAELEHSMASVKESNLKRDAALGRSLEEPLLRALTALSQSGGGGGTHAPAGSIFIGRQIAYVADYDVEIAQGSSIAEPKISVQNEGAVLTARSLGISGYSTRLHLRVLDQALRKAAGDGPKKAAPQAWADWLKSRPAKDSAPDSADG